MSVSINCGPKTNDMSRPADAYGGMLFYAGSFEIQGNSVTHAIKNSNSVGLMGTTVIRKVEELTKSTLVLTGKLDGDSLRIVWRR
jgi:hypothetical protein